MQELEFFHQSLPVGYFEDSAYPEKDGTYRYMPYRGPGHEEMQEELEKIGASRCYFDSKQGRHFFKVLANSEIGLIEIGEFTISAIPETNLVSWLEPWVPAMPGLEKELEKEVPNGHLLYNQKCIPIARRIDSDDVLFQIASQPTRYALVHLTWSGKMETDPNFPRTILFQDLEDWVEKGMKIDHQSFMGEF